MASGGVVTSVQLAEEGADVEADRDRIALGGLELENVGAVLTRAMEVQGDTLVIRLETTAADGTPVTRTLTWQRVS